MTILMVTHGLPFPPYGGSKIRDLNTIQCLSQHHSVILLSLTTDSCDVSSLSFLRQYCQYVDIVSGARSVVDRLGATLRGCVAGRPLAAAPYYFDEMAAKIRDIIARRAVDVVLFEQAYVAPYIEDLGTHRTCRAVLSLHNVASSQYQSMQDMQLGRSRKVLQIVKALLMARMESRYIDRFDHCIVVSSTEARRLRATNARLPISIIENGVDTAACRPLQSRAGGNDLLFVGNMNYAPNADAAQYFCHAVLPIIRQAHPDVELYIVGDGPPSILRRFAAMKGVVVTGAVPDVTPYYERAQVAVAPLRAGGGTRLKILEAMALGRPVTSTSLGCEGLDVTDRKHLFIADTPSAFADAVTELLADHALRERVARDARRLVESRYDWASANHQLVALFGNDLMSVSR